MASQLTTFVALLRGVNVGKAKRVPMAELRALIEGLGHTEVKTLLNSGNAIFKARGGSPPKHAAAIAEAISQNLGLSVPVIVKSAAELESICEENTLAGDTADPARLLVAFVQDGKALAGLSAIEPLLDSAERFVLGTHAAYMYCANGILGSKAGEALLGKVGKAATTRNWSTVLKLNALANP